MKTASNGGGAEESTGILSSVTTESIAKQEASIPFPFDLLEGTHLLYGISSWRVAWSVRQLMAK